MGIQKELPFSLDPLDPKFVPPKPKNSVEESKVTALEKRGDLIITRKRDGYRHLVAITKNGVRIYTRGIEDVTARYPHIAGELKGANFPFDVLVDGEMVVDDAGQDRFEALTKIAKSKPEVAVVLQHELLKTHFMVFDVVVWRGEVVLSRPYGERLKIVSDNFHFDFVGNISSVPVLSCSFVEAKNLVKRSGWEGLVLYDRTKSSTFRLDGKIEQPPRPEGCWKWKPLREDDFFVERWQKGTGRNKDRMGKLFLLQVDPRIGKKVACGEVGTGFSDEEREALADDTKYPLVVEIAYERRFASGALRFPRFLRIRDDKKPKECILPLEELEMMRREE